MHSEYVTLDDMLTKWYGPVGSPKRDRADRNTKRRVKAEHLAYRATRHLGPVGVYWIGIWDTAINNFDLGEMFHSGADILQFNYLGDFGFHHRPVTQTYFDSWMSKVHLPRALHLHQGPERCSHVD